MKQEKFIKVLNKEGYSYKIEGDKIIVTSGDLYGDVDLQSLTSLPPGVVFKNKGDVDLQSLTSLPPGVKFNNRGHVDLQSLSSKGSVNLRSLTSLPPDVEFKNGDDVYLKSIIGGWFDKWSGNIKYIDSKSLLNLMIKRGMFI